MADFTVRLIHLQLDCVFGPENAPDTDFAVSCKSSKSDDCDYCYKIAPCERTLTFKRNVFIRPQFHTLNKNSPIYNDTY
jgi:hypothetical protein